MKTYKKAFELMQDIQIKIIVAKNLSKESIGILIEENKNIKFPEKYLKRMERVAQIESDYLKDMKKIQEFVELKFPTQ